MPLRAIILDYGKVLSYPQDPKAYNEMLRITGLPREQFERYYWTDRSLYDDGTLTGLAFWQKFAHDAELPLSHEQIKQLNYWDCCGWLSINPAMLAWQLRLKERGFLTAILSNMGDSVLEKIERELAWIHRFDVQVWSYQHHMVKPDPQIYRYTLHQLNVTPEETLFLDDKIENVEAAEALGIKAIQFTTVDQLRVDLTQADMDKELPLP